MTEPREPRDERGPDDVRDVRDVREPGDARDVRDVRDSRELGEKMDKQERRMGVTSALFVVVGMLVVGMTVIGVFAIREPKQREQADEQESIARSIENCRSDNETRVAVIELVRRLEGDGDDDGAASIFPIPIPPGAGADVIALIEYVNSAAGASQPEGEPEPSATELAEETLPRNDCTP